MALAVIQFFRKAPTASDWSQQDLAQFYRVESALIQGGLRIESDRGVTEEGDPWFVFCREDTGDPVVHFARIGGEYLIASPAFDGIVRGYDFRSLIQDLVGRHRLVQTSERSRGTIFLHPAAILIAIVGTAFFKVSEASAADSTSDQSQKSFNSAVSHGLFDPSPLSAFFSPLPAASKAVAVEINRNYAFVALSAAMAMLDINSDQSGSGIWNRATVSASEETNFHSSSVASQTTIAAIGEYEAATSKSTVSKPIDLTPASLEQATVLVAILKDLPSASQYLADVHLVVNSNVRLATVTNETVTTVDSIDPPAHPDPSLSLTLHLSATQIDLPLLQSAKLITTLAKSANLEISFSSDGLPSALAALFEHGRSVLESGGATQFLLAHQEIFNIAGSHSQVLNQPTLVQDRFAATSSATQSFSDTVMLSNSSTQGGVDASSDAVAAVLKNYLHENAGSKLIITKDAYVFTAGGISGDAPNLESFTVKFSDGSSISLVGQHAALQHVFDVVA